MATSPMPTRDAGPTPDDLSGVVSSSPEQPAQAPQQDSGRTQAVRMIRQLTTQIDSLAQQFPEIAEATKAASQALVKAAVAITGNSPDAGKAAAPPNR